MVHPASKAVTSPTTGEHRWDLRRGALAALCVVMGWLAISAQVLLIREFLVVFYGNELCLGVIFASWLLGIVVGAWICGRLLRRGGEPTRLLFTLQILMVISLPAQITLIRLVRLFVDVQPGGYAPLVTMLWLPLLCILPFGVLVGFLFPVVCRVFARSGRRAAQDIGWVYILESLGSMGGGLILTLFLIGRYQPYTIVCILSLLVMGAAFVLALVWPSPRTRRVYAGPLLALFVAGALLLGSPYLGVLETSTVKQRWRAFFPGITLVEWGDSPYQHISVAREMDQYSVFGNGQLITTFPDFYQAAVLAHFYLSEHPAPKRVLLVGGGMGGLLREMLSHSLARLDYVELDARLVQTVERYLSPEDREVLTDPRVRLIHTDGRRFIRESTDRYDMVILHIPEPTNAMVNRFYTADFYREVKRILAPGGVLATSILAAVNYMGPEVANYSGSVYRTLQEVFRHVLATPGDRNHFFASADADVVTVDIGTLAARYAASGAQSDYFQPEHFWLLLPPDRVEALERAYRRRQNLPVNTDLKPVTYFFSLVLWDRFSGGRLSGLLMRLSRASIWWFLIPLAIFLGGRFVSLLLRRPSATRQLRFNGLLAITAAGFAAMALEIVLIFAYQNSFGYLYQRIGLVVALFMLGLALGGCGMNVWLRRERGAWVEVLTALVWTIAGFALLLPTFLRLISALDGASSEALFFVLIAFAGVLTGAEFPLVSRILLTVEEGTGWVAGIIDGFDHLGACLGALVTGTLLVPLLGLHGASFFAGALNALSGVLLLVSLFHRPRPIPRL